MKPSPKPFIEVLCLLSLTLLQSCGASASVVADAETTSESTLSFSATTIHPVQSNALCIDVVNAGTTNGTPVQIATCNGNAAQSWTSASGQLQVFSTKCLTVTGGVNANGTQLTISDCVAGNTAQVWAQKANTWVWTAGNKCIDIPSDNVVSGARLQVYTCNGTGAQNFSVAGASATTVVSTPATYHPSANSAMCLDVAGGAQTNGTAVQIATCNSGSAQNWSFVNGTMQVFGGKCLDVPGGANVDGTKLQIWDCGTGNTNQQWHWQGNILVWTAGNKCLDVPYNNATDGTRIQIYDCTSGDAAQVWNGTALGTATSTGTGTTSGTAPGGAHSGKYVNLVWSDEMNGNSLDTSKWSYEVNCDGGGNNEDECYTQSPQNLYSDGQGHMVFEVRKSNVALSNGKTYTSARINSLNKGDFIYGRWEASIRVPSGQGFWPAFWTMPSDSAYGSWPTSGELDIMEILGGSPGTLYGTAHYGVPSPYTQSGGTSQGGDFSTAFHIYALERDQHQVRWYVDNTLYFTMNDTGTSFWPAGYNPGDGTVWPFTKRFYTILNVAMGGNWPGAPNASIQSGGMAVDYVRIFQ